MNSQPLGRGHSENAYPSHRFENKNDTIGSDVWGTILKFSDLPAVRALVMSCKFLYELNEEKNNWQKLSIKRFGKVYKTIREINHYLNETIKVTTFAMFWVFELENEKIIAELKPLLNYQIKELGPSTETINTFLGFSMASNNLFFWDKFTCALRPNTTIFDKSFKETTLPEFLVKGNQFSPWCEENKLELGALSNFSYCSSDTLFTVPPEISYLSKIQNLNLNHCFVYSISNELCSLEALTCLSLRNSNLTHFPKVIFCLTQLRHLTVSHNSIELVSKKIGTLTNLTNLDLSNNKLTKIPKSIHKLQKLKLLSLAHNRLLSIPPSIGNLTNLNLLSLNFNNLTMLPHELNNLKSLKYLQIHDNQISQLPQLLKGMKQLKCLMLENNPLSHIPEDKKYCIQTQVFEPVYPNATNPNVVNP